MRAALCNCNILTPSRLSNYGKADFVSGNIDQGAEAYNSVREAYDQQRSTSGCAGNRPAGT